MARLIGDYKGTTWDDFLVLPDRPIDDKEFTPEEVDISTDLAGVKLDKPFLTAAMRSVTGKDLALASGKLGMMAVAPRGLKIKRQVEIVDYVKKNRVKVGEVESECSPTTVFDTDTLGIAVGRASNTGHSYIPVVTEKHDLVGMFSYKPSEHDKMDVGMPVTKAMQPYRARKKRIKDVCRNDMSDAQIKEYLREKNLRFVPVIDEVGRLDRLVFIQRFDAYKVGAAIDTHPGWERRVEKLIEAGADMIFIDTSDALKPFSKKVIEKYKKMYKDGPPICGGNVVTPEGFDYLVEAGADAIKIGMGPGSICTTNEVLGVGAPPFWSLVEVSKRRDKYKDRYIPIIADGGIDGTHAINVALTHADAIMGGKIFGCFLESEGDKFDENINILPRDGTSEEKIRYIRIYGEGSREARETTGDMKRYKTPNAKGEITTFQGVSGLVLYKGRLKPGVEGYIRALKEAMYHSGASDLEIYRKKAVLIRLSERAKETARPHGIDIIGD